LSLRAIFAKFSAHFIMRRNPHAQKPFTICWMVRLVAHGVWRETGGRSLNSVPAGQGFARKKLEGARRASTGDIQTFLSSVGGRPPVQLARVLRASYRRYEPTP
jgi:hypothetical protein